MSKNVERRREFRVPTNIPVGVSTLTPTHLSLEGVIANMSGRGLQLWTNVPLATGRLVRLETNQFLLLGEVCYCEKQGERWRIGIQLEHALANLAQLTRLNERLFAEDTRKPGAITTASSS
jgi:hypothetical protein